MVVGELSKELMSAPFLVLHPNDGLPWFFIDPTIAIDRRFLRRFLVEWDKPDKHC